MKRLTIITINIIIIFGLPGKQPSKHTDGREHNQLQRNYYCYCIRILKKSAS